MSQHFGIDDLKRLVDEAEQLKARIGGGDWFSLCEARRLLQKMAAHSDPEFQQCCEWLARDMPHKREAADLCDDIGDWPEGAYKTRVINCLLGGGIKRLSDLGKLDRDTILATPNFGRKSMQVLDEIMRRKGLKFAERKRDRVE